MPQRPVSFDPTRSPAVRIRNAMVSIIACCGLFGILPASPPDAQASIDHVDPPDNPMVVYWIDVQNWEMLENPSAPDSFANLVLTFDVDWGEGHRDRSHQFNYTIAWSGSTALTPISLPLPPEGLATHHMECSPAAVPVVTPSVTLVAATEFDKLLVDLSIGQNAALLGAAVGGPAGAIVGVTVGLVARSLVHQYLDAETPISPTDYVLETEIKQAVNPAPWNACDSTFPGNRRKRGHINKVSLASIGGSPTGRQVALQMIENGIDESHPIGCDPVYAQERLRLHRAAMFKLQHVVPPCCVGVSDLVRIQTMREGLAGLADVARAEEAEALSLGISDSQVASFMSAAAADSAAGDFVSATDQYDRAIVRLLHLNHPEYDVRLRAVPPQDLVAPTISGLAVRSLQTVTKSFYLYPSACADRASGTWTPRTSPVADSLDAYALGDPPFEVGGNDIMGPLWTVVSGNQYPTYDPCHPEKQLGSNRMIAQGDPVTKSALVFSHDWIQTCVFPIPTGIADVAAAFNVSAAFSRYSGLSYSLEYRVFRSGIWSRWVRPIDHAEFALDEGGGGIWSSRRTSLPRAVGADSVQIRYTADCNIPLTLNGERCDPSELGVLIDDLRLELTTGSPKPLVYLAPEHLPQSTFVDGTMTGLNCSVAPCWPGPLGTDVASHPNPELAGRAIDDNVNSPSGDFIRIFAASALGNTEGTGLNWRRGFEARTVYYTNADFNPAFDAPRMIYRLFDPATATWSPWDSTELYADDMLAVPTDTLLLNGALRVDWPPQDKLDSAATLPGGFTVNGAALYSDLRYLPRGARLQYYFKVVDIAGGVTYAYSAAGSPLETVELPALPGSAIRAPDIFEFAVLPGRYATGPEGSLLAGRVDTPILSLDAAYQAWSAGIDPITQTLRGLGVRADRLRLQPGVGFGHSIGGHERVGQRIDHYSNHLPNMDEYALLDSLAAWYRILILSSDAQQHSVVEEQDAALIEAWAKAPTGADGGDRCLFASGDDFFTTLTYQGSGIAGPARGSLATSVFGIANTLSLSGSRGTWVGTYGNANPTIDDRFAAPGSGPGLAAPGSFTYPLDGGCPRWNFFDPLTPDAGGTATAAYPVAATNQDAASVSSNGEFDGVADNDRTKALGYGFSIGQVRHAGVPTQSPNYVNSGAQNRLRIIHKFLTGCRGARTTEPSVCWPCPTDPAMFGEWAAQSGYQTGTYGTLYPIQALALATSVEEIATAPPVHINALAQNRPNPFNPHTIIDFSLERSGRVELHVFDVAGRLVRTLLRAPLAAGRHHVTWDGRSGDGRSVASGVYFYRIQYPDGSRSSRSLVLLR